jgi:hypothetical protein
LTPRFIFFLGVSFFHEKGRLAREISIRKNIPYAEKLTFNEVSSILVTIDFALWRE